MAGKARVHELAKELGKTSKDIMAKLTEMGEFVKSPSSTIEAPVVRKLRDAFPAQAGAAKLPANGSHRRTSNGGPGRPGAPAPRPHVRRPGPAPVAARRPLPQLRAGTGRPRRRRPRRHPRSPPARSARPQLLVRPRRAARRGSPPRLRPAPAAARRTDCPGHRLRRPGLPGTGQCPRGVRRVRRRPPSARPPQRLRTRHPRPAPTRRLPARPARPAAYQARPVRRGWATTRSEPSSAVRRRVPVAFPACRGRRPVVPAALPEPVPPAPVPAPAARLVPVLPVALRVPVPPAVVRLPAVAPARAVRPVLAAVVTAAVPVVPVPVLPARRRRWLPRRSRWFDRWSRWRRCPSRWRRSWSRWCGWCLRASGRTGP